jgi:hypothetical protein
MSNTRVKRNKAKEQDLHTDLPFTIDKFLVELDKEYQPYFQRNTDHYRWNTNKQIPHLNTGISLEGDFGLWFPAIVWYNQIARVDVLDIASEDDKEHWVISPRFAKKQRIRFLEDLFPLDEYQDIGSTEDDEDDEFSSDDDYAVEYAGIAYSLSLKYPCPLETLKVNKNQPPNKKTLDDRTYFLSSQYLIFVERIIQPIHQQYTQLMSDISPLIQFAKTHMQDCIEDIEDELEEEEGIISEYEWLPVEILPSLIASTDIASWKNHRYLTLETREIARKMIVEAYHSQKKQNNRT